MNTTKEIEWCCLIHEKTKKNKKQKTNKKMKRNKKEILMTWIDY